MILVNPKFSLITLGCKVNQYDSKEIKERLEGMGLREAENHSPSDIVFINTCTITDTADRKSFFMLKQTLSKNPRAMIFVTGCAVDYHEGNFYLDDKRVIFVKNKDKARVDKIVSQYINLEPNLQSGFGKKRNTHTRAIVKVQDGCENFCSYCVLPFVRGSIKSRYIEDIVGEIKILADTDIKEVILSGICLGSYGKDLKENLDLSMLLEQVEYIKGNFRIRLSSIEPKYVTEKLIGILSSSRRVCPHIHLPFQSGDDGILEKMNRPYTSSYYIALVDKLRSVIPNIAITTDIIVGFPGESDKNFYSTLSFLKRVRPSRIHVFPYSDRNNTFASKLKDKVSADIKLERAKLIRKLGEMYSFGYRRDFLNKTLRVLVESRFDKKTNLYCGYSENYIRVRVDCKEDLSNKVIDVKIKEITKELAIGNPINSPSQPLLFQ